MKQNLNFHGRNKEKLLKKKKMKKSNLILNTQIILLTDQHLLHQIFCENNKMNWLVKKIN